MYLAYYLGRKEENKETTLVDQIICFFTRSRYSHVELIYDWSPVTKRGRCFSSSPRDGGVRGKTIDFGDGHWEVYELKYHLSHNKVVDFFMNEYGKKYDWLGAIGSAFPVLKENRKRWFCSEIIMHVLRYANPWVYTPQEMYNELRLLQKRIL